MSLRPTTSRIAASPTSCTVRSGSRTLKRKSVAPPSVVFTLYWTMNWSFTMLPSPVSIRASVSTSRYCAGGPTAVVRKPNSSLRICVTDGLNTRSNGQGKMVSRPRVGFPHDLSEAQHDAALVGRDDVDAAQDVEHEGDQDDEPGAEVEARRTADRRRLPRSVRASAPTDDGGRRAGLPTVRRRPGTRWDIAPAFRSRRQTVRSCCVRSRSPGGP